MPEKLRADSYKGIYRHPRFGFVLWISPGAFQFRREHVLWALQYWDDIMQYRWPDSPMDDVQPDNRIAGPAQFEIVVGIKVELEGRLSATGRDGQMLLDRHHYGKTLDEVHRTYNCGLDAIDRGMRDALRYICGRRKERSYEEFLNHRKGGR